MSQMYLVKDQDGYYIRSAPPPRQTAQGLEWSAPTGALCGLTADEARALEYFDLWEPWYEVFEAYGGTVAERFADEAALRLNSYDPSLGQLSFGHSYHGANYEGRDALAADIRRAIAEWPSCEMRMPPMQFPVRIFRNSDGTTVSSPSEPEQEKVLNEDPQSLAVQISETLWELCRTEPQVEEEILARVEMQGPQQVADLIESYIKRWYLQDRIAEPLGMRIYSGVENDKSVHIICGEDDPIPPQWEERRRRQAERREALRLWAQEDREFWWTERTNDEPEIYDRVEATYRGNTYPLSEDVARQVRESLDATRRTGNSR